MDYGVILVTVNYRLGPLGWLSLGDSVLPGNLGLWDIIMATQFTKDRISHFGGDPNKVIRQFQFSEVLKAFIEGDVIRAVCRRDGSADVDVKWAC